MSLTVEFLEEGEIESDTDDLSKCRKSSSAPNVRENGHDRANGDAVKSEEKSSRQSRRKRKRDSRERSGSREESVAAPAIDPTEIAEMDEYEMLCIRGASPPHGVAYSGMDEAYQPLLGHNTTYYEYERDYRYESDDDGYLKRRRTPPHKRRKERARRRHRLNKRTSPEKRDRRRRSKSLDEQDSREDRKMEICKFYLLECCVKRSICKYMHSEFPCKYFHLGLECQNEKPCKFSHGKALSEEMTQALARHVAAAPKAILGNFKRYSRDKALIMIQAKNRELNDENGITGKDTLPNKKDLKSNKKSSPSKHSIQTQQDISAIFSVQQMEKITALGITNLQQVKQMSLAQLTDIGLSLGQIGELQKIAENDQKYSSQSLALLCKPQDEGVEANSSKGDMDMRQLLPLLPTIKTTVNDRRISVEDDDMDIVHEGSTSPLQKSDEIQVDICSNQEEIDDNNMQGSDLTISYGDDEPELVIDESIDPSEDQSYNENNKPESLSDPLTSNYYNIQEPERNDSQNEKRSSPTISDEELFDSISFEDPFEPISFYSENKFDPVESIGNQKTQESEKIITGPVLSDFDMRLPFADVIANYVPAMEIDASIRSHLGIKYKLIEIVIPDNKGPNIRPENIPGNTLDPRLKKLINTKNMKNEDNVIRFKIQKKDKMTFVNPYKTENQSSDISVDPRKRKEQASEFHPKPIQQNFNYVLNSFLQKSKWFQNLNSKSKMEINQYLADLTVELNKFSQITSRDKSFQISAINNAIQISEILSEIGLEINKDGIIQERKQPPPNPEPDEFTLPTLPDVFANDLPSLLNINPAQNFPIPNTTFTANNSSLQNNVISAMQTMSQQRFEFPKPGLLGIAPGIEVPPLFLHTQNNGPNFNNGLNPLIWSDPPPNYVIQANLPKRCPAIDDLSRNPFATKTGKRWNRKPGAKKPRRI